MSQDSEKKKMGRLVLTLKDYEKICIGTDVEVQLLFVKGKQARVAFTAPLEMKIGREKIEVKKPSGVA